MKSLNMILLSSGLALTSLPACAAHGTPVYSYAKVVDARPVYETVRYPVDQRVCWEEESLQRHSSGHSAAPTIMGAIIGGVVGHQFGGGHGKDALTVAGAALGGSIGHSISKQKHPDRYYPVVEQRCEIERSWQTEQQLAYWDVTYRHRGRLYHTRTMEQPGSRIRVRD